MQAQEVFKDNNIILATDLEEGLVSYFIPEAICDNFLTHIRSKVSDEQPATEYITEVIEHFPMSLEDDIILLQPTCPLREPDDIVDALSIYELHKETNKTLVSVCEFEDMHRAYVGVGDEVGSLLLRYGLKLEEEKIYIRNSSIYIFNVGYFMENRKIFDDKASVYVMPKFKSIDINTTLDFRLAEFIYQRPKKKLGGEFIKWKPYY
jgi:CMP-N-acetylneuraminic acid synthetase